MVPLKIECRLAGPWCPPAHGLHLDGLLAWSTVEGDREVGRMPSDVQAGYSRLIEDLPLQRDEASGTWCASMFYPVGWQRQERRYLTAKTPVEALAAATSAGIVDPRGGAKIDTQRGAAKNAQAYYTVEYAWGLRAWCIGDADAVAQLLERVRAVGVKTRLGLGSLMGAPDVGQPPNGQLWSVEECPEAQDLWKLRNSPIKLVEESYPARGAWKAPYWLGSEPIWRPAPRRLQLLEPSAVQL